MKEDKIFMIQKGISVPVDAMLSMQRIDATLYSKMCLIYGQRANSFCEK